MHLNTSRTRLIDASGNVRFPPIADIRSRSHKELMVAKQSAGLVSLTHVISALEELSDRDEQVRLWLSTGDGGAEVSSFVEAVECLFSDSGLTHALERGFRAERGGRTDSKHEAIFDDRTDALIRQLSATIGRINDRRAPEDLIDDPDMEQVRREAMTVLHALRQHSGGAD